MKKTLFPLAIVFSLLAVACSKSDSGSSSSAKARILPEFSASSLESKTPATPRKSTSIAYVVQALKQTAGPATTFEPDSSDLGGECFETQEGASQVKEKGRADLKSAVVQSAQPVLCYINSMNDAMVKENLVAGVMHTKLDASGEFVTKYFYAPDSTSADGVTYSRLVFFDASDNAEIAMMWSKEPKTFALFQSAPIDDENGLPINEQVFVYLTAYQKGEDFHFQSVAASATSPFAYTRGIWSQLSYDSSLGAFFGIEGYSLKGRNSTQASIAGVLKGNVKTGHAGIRITESESGTAPSTESYYFGDFAGADASAYRNLVEGIKDTTANFVPAQMLDSASKLKTPDKAITLESMKSVTLPAFTDPIYTK